MLFKFFLLVSLSPVIWAGGWLQINSEPAQATVYINGEYRGLTPKPPDRLKLNLVVGKHRLRLHWSQGQDYYQKIKIEEGQSLVLSVQQNMQVSIPPSETKTISPLDSNPKPSPASKLIPIPRNF